jgi:hypothetical protein
MSLENGNLYNETMIAEYNAQQKDKAKPGLIGKAS